MADDLLADLAAEIGQVEPAHWSSALIPPKMFSMTQNAFDIAFN